MSEYELNILTSYNLAHESPRTFTTVDFNPRLSRCLPHILAIPMHWRYPVISAYPICQSEDLA